MSPATLTEPKPQTVYEPDDKNIELIEFGRKHGLLGESAVFLKFLKELRRFSIFSHLVLLEGETGTGKELAARALHGERTGNFIPLNCSSLLGETGRSELAGYKGGSFTGSDRTDRPGLFARAKGGTLLLDEVQLLKPDAQAELLRVLQTKRILPLGGTEEVDVSTTRVVLASNEDIAEMVRRNAFREDLYFRIHILVTRLPPLRERMEDIPLLVGHFIAKHREEFESAVQHISNEALSRLFEHAWPGNVRELENLIIAILIRKENGSTIQSGDLPEDTFGSKQENTSVEEQPSSLPTANSFLFHHRFDTTPTMDAFQKIAEPILIRRALTEANGSYMEAARILDIARETLRHRVREYGISVKETAVPSD